jgi:type VI secretion system protein ImpH
MSSRIFLKYAGILWQQPRSLVGLEQILSDFFKTRVRVHPFQGHFEKIDSDDWTIIGSKEKNSSLGINAVIGQKSWIASAHLIIEFGPFSEHAAEPFFKGNLAYSYLKTFVKTYCGSIYTFDAHLLCRPTKPLQSGLKTGSQMGWTSVIGKRMQDTRIIVHYSS